MSKEGTIPKDSKQGIYLPASLASTFCLSASLTFAISSRLASYLAYTWLKGFSSLFSNSFRQSSTRCCFLSPGFSFSISGNLLASYAAYAALNLRSGWRSTFVESPALVRERASSALSMPDALRVAPLRLAGSSSCERSRPRDFFAGAFAFPLPFDGREASSAARRASRSAFFRAASAFLASASSFLALLFAPFAHCLSSSADRLASSAAFFWAAASAFCHVSRCIIISYLCSALYCSAK